MATQLADTSRRIGINGHPLTEEQENILSLPPTETRKWQAFAGCAKTTTSVEYTHAWPDYRALYLAFNAAIAAEAKGRFPAHVQTQTAHGHAYQALGMSQYRDRLVNRLRPNDIDGCRDLLRPIGGMTDIAVRRAILRSMNNFLISGDDEVQEYHLAGVPTQVRRAILPMFAAVIERFMDYESGNLPITHDIYLKAFARTRVISNQFDYLIIDEAQDLNPVLIDIVRKADRPTVIVGDPWQCLPPGEMISTPSGDIPIEELKVGDQVLSADGSGGFRSRKITRIHSSFAKNGLVVITTEGGRTIRTTPDHTHFAGYNGRGYEHGWCVYLMYREGFGFRLGMACDYSTEFDGRNMKGWRGRSNQERADYSYVLKTGLEREEAAILEAVWSLQYGIPTTVFRNRNAKKVAFSDNYIASIFHLVDSESGAKKLLSDLRIDPSAPHYRPKAMRKGRLNFSVTLCGERGMHRYAISGSEESDRNALENAGIRTRQAKNSCGWRVESSTINLGHIYAQFDLVKSVSNAHLIEKAKLADGAALPFTPASNCMPGMSIFVFEEATGKVTTDTIKSVRHEKYDELVYDIDVEHSHNFVANGIVTHNSIYAFRGAEQAMAAITGETLPLSQSFRFGPKIAEIANQVLRQSLERPDHPIIGNPHKKSVVEQYQGKLRRRSTILARTNFRLFESLVKVSVPFHVVGGIDEMINQVQAGYALYKGHRPPVIDPIVSRFMSWEACKDASEYEDEPELTRLVRIVELYTDEIPEILAGMRKRHTADERRALIVVSTAHKAKGREWPHVVVLDDFFAPNQLRAMLGRKRITAREYNQEINLLYVTLTRAIETLAISQPLFDEVAGGAGLSDDFWGK